MIFFNADVPSPIKIGLIRNLSDCNVNLTWSPPRDNGCPLEKYTIYYRQRQLRKEELLPWHETSITNVAKTFSVLSLKCGRKYELTLTASNQAGESSKSSPWRIITAGVLIVLRIISLKQMLYCDEFYHSIGIFSKSCTYNVFVLTSFDRRAHVCCCSLFSTTRYFTIRLQAPRFLLEAARLLTIRVNRNREREVLLF